MMAEAMTSELGLVETCSVCEWIALGIAELMEQTNGTALCLGPITDLYSVHPEAFGALVGRRRLGARLLEEYPRVKQCSLDFVVKVARQRGTAYPG